MLLGTHFSRSRLCIEEPFVCTQLERKQRFWQKYRQVPRTRIPEHGGWHMPPAPALVPSRTRWARATWRPSAPCTSPCSSASSTATCCWRRPRPNRVGVSRLAGYADTAWPQARDVQYPRLHPLPYPLAGCERAVAAGALDEDTHSIVSCCVAASL